MKNLVFFSLFISLAITGSAQAQSSTPPSDTPTPALCYTATPSPTLWQFPTVDLRTPTPLPPNSTPAPTHTPTPTASSSPTPTVSSGAIHDVRVEAYHQLLQVSCNGIDSPHLGDGQFFVFENLPEPIYCMYSGTSWAGWWDMAYADFYANSWPGDLAVGWWRLNWRYESESFEEIYEEFTRLAPGGSWRHYTDNPAGSPRAVEGWFWIGSPPVTPTPTPASGIPTCGEEISLGCSENICFDVGGDETLAGCRDLWPQIYLDVSWLSDIVRLSWPSFAGLPPIDIPGVRFCIYIISLNVSFWGWSASDTLAIFGALILVGLISREIRS